MLGKITGLKFYRGTNMQVSKTYLAVLVVLWTFIGAIVGCWLGVYSVRTIAMERTLTETQADFLKALINQCSGFGGVVTLPATCTITMAPEPSSSDEPAALLPGELPKFWRL